MGGGTGFRFRCNYRIVSALALNLFALMPRISASIRTGVLIAFLLGLSACGGILRNPLPAENYMQASFLGRHDLRFWGDADLPADQSLLGNGDPAVLEKNYSGIMHKEHHYLAISGGGANGAYGAGLLVGWSAMETRPEFTMVTGISTGALSAPFAFLGSAYDDKLKEVYTTLNTTSIYKAQSFLTMLGGDSLVDTSPLSMVIEKFISDDVIAEIAREYRKGRALLIGTTNLDAGRPLVWNIGRIANTGHPDAPDMIRKILRASASLPGLFPPVYFPVQGADGKMYDEMHVDGGTSSQLFLYPSKVDWHHIMEVLDVRGPITAYLIRNSVVTPHYDAVDPKLAPIVSKTIGSLIRTQGIGDIFRIYTLAQRDGVDVKLTWIPENAVSQKPEEAFDSQYMQALFDYGYQRATKDAPWVDVAEVVKR